MFHRIVSDLSLQLCLFYCVLFIPHVCLFYCVLFIPQFSIPFDDRYTVCFPLYIWTSISVRIQYRIKLYLQSVYATRYVSTQYYSPTKTKYGWNEKEWWLNDMIVRMHDDIYMQCHKISYLAAPQHTRKTYIAFTTSPFATFARRL